MRETSDPPEAPKIAAAADKVDRLAEALRANLARRKQQQRARKNAEQGDDEG